MLPDLPWYGWLIIIGICVISFIVKFPIYRKILGKKKEQGIDKESDGVSGDGIGYER